MNAVSQRPIESGEPLFVSAGAGPFIDLGDHRGNVKISPKCSGDAFLLVELEVDPEGGPPPHLHTQEDETFYILEGRFEMQVGDQIVEAVPGDTLFGPRYIAHSWRCISSERGRLLALVSPGANFEAFAVTMAQSGFDPKKAMSDPAAVAALVALAESHGIEMLPPIK